MKRRGLRSKIALLFAAVLTLSSAGVLPAHAGASTIVVDKSSFAEKIDEGIWSNPDEVVTVENKMLVFPKESTADTRLITKTIAKVSEMNNELLHVNAIICPEVLPSGETFVMAMGLSGIEAFMGESGNVEVQFQNKGGIKASVVAYGDDGEQTIVKAVSAGKVKSDIQVEVSILKSGELTLKLGGRQVGKGKIPVDGEGRVGFLQTGSCAVKVKDFAFRSYKYDTPENCDIYEDFENGAMNVNLLTSMMTGYPSVYTPSYSTVQEYKGNQVFYGNNAGGTYIGSLYKYSNFELSFDIPYLKTLPEWSEDGDMLKPICGEIIVGWGCPEANPANEADYMVAEQSVYFQPGSNIVPSGYSDLAVNPEKYPFFSPQNERGVSIKVSVIDAKATVYLKWIDETKWTEVLSYNTRTQTPLGYVQLWVLTPVNLAIDNIRLINKDANPQLIEVEAKYNSVTDAEDYAYQQSEQILKDLAVKEKEFNWYLLIPATAGVCVLAFGVVLVTTLIKKKKAKKGESSNEET